MLCFCRFRQHHRHRSCPVISRREVNESAWAAPLVLSHIWPRSHHIVFPEHCHSSGTACDKRKVLQRRAHHETNGKQKNMRYLFREPFHAGKFRITWCVIGHLSHPPNVPLPHPSPCRLIVGTAMTALVCVCVCAAGTPSVCVFVYKMAPDRGEGGARVLLFSEAEIFDQLFPSEDNDESAPFHPPFLLFLRLVF